MNTTVLGISAYFHDSAAALLVDGEIVGAVQEERFTRRKGDERFPHHAIGWCLDEAGVAIDEVDHVVFYESPTLHFERLVLSYVATSPRGLRSYLRAMPKWLTEKLWLQREITRNLGVRTPVEFVAHHMSHAASAFFPSPYEEAAVLTVDGVGEWSTATWGVGRGSQVVLEEQLRYPNSVGLLYSAFTAYTGFRINSGEYKLMGLAPYGEPRFADVIERELIRVLDDGSIILNQRYFNYTTGLRSTNRRFHDLFGGPPREPESEITQREMDLAASIQVVVNRVIERMAVHVRERTGLPHLVMAGGVALNCVATGLLASNGPFEQLWTQPAAGDAGGALGAALWFWHHELGMTRRVQCPDGMRGAFLGPDIPPTSERDDADLRVLGAVWEELDDQALAVRIADSIAAGKVVGVARGRMEFGPRALGARSILGDARSPHMQSHMNLKIKFRESFRPFAPMVLAEDAVDYFDATQESPYMLLVFPVTDARRLPAAPADVFGIELLNLQRSEIPAVTHVDHSARLQTIDRVRNPFIHAVLSRFKEETGCSVIVNTSFNVRGEPIVRSAVDAYRCFLATEIDCVVIGNRFLERDAQSSRPMNDAERDRWLKGFALD